MAAVLMGSPEFKSNDEEVNSLFAESVSVYERLKEKLVGRQYRVTSNFNGQVVGSSRKPLTGKVFTVKSVVVSPSHVSVWDGDYNHCFVDLSEVELLNDHETE